MQVRKSFSRFAPSDKLLERCQEQLGVSLPDQYIEFLMALGQGGFNGVYVLGFSRAGAASFVEETMEYRGYGLPKSLVAIENCDEWVFCLDCGDGSVVAWSTDGAVNRVYDCFDSYFLDRLNDAIENL